MRDQLAATAWVTKLVDGGLLPDAVLGIADASGARTVSAFGGARSDDRYPLFSVTKPIVALAVVRAVERGELSLRMPLSRALPGIGDGALGTVRLHHLLSHTSGIGEPALDDPTPLPRLLAGIEQRRPPGSTLRYSSLAFAAAAALLETATGRSLDDHIAELTAYGTDRSLSFDELDARRPTGAEAAGFDHDALVAQRHPGAGLMGTATTLLDLGTELLRSASGRSALVRPSSLAAMTRQLTVGLPDPEPEPERREFGLGWQVRREAAGLLADQWFGHAGWAGSQWWIDPIGDRVVVLLTSIADFPQTGVDADELLNAIVPSVRAD
jgi:CubicO group peptidase (beta-lactamase class C family)